MYMCAKAKEIFSTKLSRIHQQATPFAHIHMYMYTCVPYCPVHVSLIFDHQKFACHFWDATYIYTSKSVKESGVVILRMLAGVTNTDVAYMYSSKLLN